jgi:hypothetical protein
MSEIGQGIVGSTPVRKILSLLSLREFQIVVGIDQV